MSVRRNHLGSGAAENARLAAITALAMGVTVAAITSGGLTLNAKVWTGFYTDGGLPLRLLSKSRLKVSDQTPILLAL